jgi:Zn-dependent protease
VALRNTTAAARRSRARGVLRASAATPLAAALPPDDPAPLPGACLRVRVCGLPVWIHWSFPAVGLGIGVPVGLVALVTASHLALSLFAWSAFAVAVLVLVHEFGHAVAARFSAVEVSGLVFAAGGGACLVGEAAGDVDDLLFSAGGLAAQAALLACSGAWLWSLGAAKWPAPDHGATVFSAVNLLLLVVNAWPGAHSDGARIVRALHRLRARQRR